MPSTLATSNYLQAGEPNTQFTVPLKTGELWPMKYKKTFSASLLGKGFSDLIESQARLAQPSPHSLLEQSADTKAGTATAILQP